MKLLRLFATLALLFSVIYAPAVAQSVVTAEKLYPELDEILKKAVAQSPRMINRAIDLENAENDRIAARAGLLPNIGGSFSYYEAKEKRGDIGERMNVPRVYYAFSISQPLFHWGERMNNAKAGQIRELMVQGNYREAYRIYVQEVRNLYLSLIIGKLRSKRAAFNLEYANGQLRQGEERLEQKVISDGQMFSIRIAAERAQVEAERLAYQQQINLASFARLTGQQLRAEDVPDAVPSVDSQASVLQGLVQGFLAQSELPTNEALYMRRALELERLNLANQKTRLKPKLSLVLSATQDEQRYETIGYKYEVQSYYAGVSIYWTMFDGFSTRSAVRSSMAKIRAMENDYRVLTERLGEQAQDQLRLADFALRAAAINDKLLESSEGNLHTKREQFDRGAISKEEVDIAQLALYDAQLTAYSHRMEYLVKISELLGTVVEDPILANLPAGK